MTTRPLTTALLLAAGLALPARAETISVAADVNTRTITLDEQVMLTVSVSGDTGSLPTPKLPPMPNFIVHAAGRSQSTTIVNTKISSSEEHHFLLVPKVIGRAVIGPITVNVGGQSVQTNPIEVVVQRPASGAAAQQPQRPAAQPPAQQQAPQQLPRREPPPEAQGNPDLFITADVSKRNPYVNEPVLMTVRFHYAVPMVGDAEWDPPAAQGFLREDLPTSPAILTSREGRTYYITEIKLILTPIQAGPLTIGSVGIRCQVQKQVRIDPFSQDFFDQFFSQGLAGLVTRELKTKPIPLTARPLPAEGKPAGFTGAVGRFRVKAETDRADAKVGDAVTLIVTVEGEGNLQTLGDLPLPQMDSFRAFDTVASVNTTKDDKGVRGSKTFKTVLVPKVSGDLEIPALSFAYFDPAQERYAVQRTQPLRVKVAPGSPTSPPAGYQAPEGGGEITKVTADIRYIKGSPESSALRRAVLAAGRARLVHGLPLAAFLLSLALTLYQGMMLRDPAAARARRALPKALRRVRQSRGLGDPQERASALFDTLADFVADKLDRPASGLTLRDAQRLLRAKYSRVPEGHLEQLRVLWEELEMFRFAPKGAHGAEASPLADGVHELLKALEQEMRR